MAPREGARDGISHGLVDAVFEEPMLLRQPD
jgi:hypothetical protein